MQRKPSLVLRPSLNRHAILIIVFVGPFRPFEVPGRNLNFYVLSFRRPAWIVVVVVAQNRRVHLHPNEGSLEISDVVLAVRVGGPHLVLLLKRGLDEASVLVADGCARLERDKDLFKLLSAHDHFRL